MIRSPIDALLGSMRGMIKREPVDDRFNVAQLPVESIGCGDD